MKRGFKIVNKIVLYGKGGIGKSMIASNLSTVYAKRNLKVLQIGCDPKHDSTVRLLGGKKIITVIDAAKKKEIANLTKEDIVMRGINDIDCIECGGPKPGAGCAGRGVSLMSEVLSDLNIINSGKYNVIIFDVLGDVVCGGFAAPLRLNFGEKIFIVISEELSSLYAANNITHVIKQYEYNGIYLGGFILNLRNNQADLKHVYRFVKKINSNILVTIPRSAEIENAEFKNRTVTEEYPNSIIAKKFSLLANNILSCAKYKRKKINYIEEEAFYSLF
jgi:nitrogenase iron protein NifH